MAQMLGKRPRAVHAARRSSADGPRVVHLHGYFPYDFPGAAEEKRLAAELVASDLDYHRLSNEHAAWTNRELHDAARLALGARRRHEPHRSQRAAPARVPVGAQEVARRGRTITSSSCSSVRRWATTDHQRAAEMLEEDEYKFWHGQGVKILRLSSWDGLNYLLRRIRFTDEEWDRRHRELRVAWAKASYGDLDFDDAELQEMRHGAVVASSRRHRRRRRAAGRVELNLFLPMLDGRYRRALSSMEGRAAEAPRWFEPKHDAQTIPEVELALTVGEALKRSSRSHGVGAAARASRRSRIGTARSCRCPTSTTPAGGIPVAVLQLVSSDEGLRRVERAEPADGGHAHGDARGDHRCGPSLARCRGRPHNG